MFAEPGFILAREYVENSVIEEDVSSLLKYMRRYYNLTDVVQFGLEKIDEFLNEDGDWDPLHTIAQHPG